MRLLAPICEDQRLELRQEMARAAAYAEDVQRTVTLRAEDVAHMIEQLDRREGHLP